MGYIYRQDLIHSTAIQDEVAHNSEWYDVGGCEKVAFLINMTKTSSPGNLTLVVEGTCDGGTTAITLDFQDGGGLGVSEVYSASADDLVWLDSAVTTPFVRVALTSAATTNSSNYWTPKVWLVGYRS